MTNQWQRVSTNQKCQVCGKADWCTYSTELKLIHCMRTESDRPSRNIMGGWLHKMDVWDAKLLILTPNPLPKITNSPPLQNIWYDWYVQTDPTLLEQFAEELGVNPESLAALGCVWTGEAWAIPMKNAKGIMVGMRLRDKEGNKWAVRGSKQGIFIPTFGLGSTLYITEGPTDTAAAFSMGMFAIGRPSCNACVDMISEFVELNRFSIKKVVIIADNDAPGLEGAQKLRSTLKIRTIIWRPPCKDLREFLRNGGTRSQITLG